MPHRLAEPGDGLSGARIPAGKLVLVGIGASSGGLEAASRLMEGVPRDCGMAFILIQHLDPSSESMMVELLARHTVLTVLQAKDNLPIQPEHLYVIPPATFLSVGDGVLHLSKPPARQGARMAFDFLLASMAESYGDRAGCVVLSGNGMDGSAGLRAIHAKGGLVIAQDPAEAGYDGMPRSAIQTGQVDFVLPVAEIAAALIGFPAKPNTVFGAKEASHSLPHRGDETWLPKIIRLLRSETIHDFTHYKRGTLQRRVERRMALAAIKPDAVSDYLELLRSNPRELDLLAKDLLINVTGFFRDTEVFNTLAETIIPGLVETHPPDRPLRIWVAGCSTGEETYSLAMLFIEQIEAQRRSIKLQVFASDIDADAVATGRAGLYPATIEGSVSPGRLARFFSEEEGEWRATPDLRAAIVFTVQDVLTDPPFSRLDFISCRNLLIYLQPEAQANVIGRFYFALREGGILLLGSAETIAEPDGRFEVTSKPNRLYRRIGRTRLTKPGLPAASPADRRREEIRVRAVPLPGRMPSRPAMLAELGRRLVIETYAPAAILINAANEVLFSLGPTERYLRLPPGHATHDLLAMARPGLRAKLRTTVQSARDAKATIVVSGRTIGDGQGWPFNLEVHPVLEAGEEMLLVCFVETPERERKTGHPVSAKQLPRVAELERELEAMRSELQGSVRDLELSGEEQRAINEEALSVNEEYQSTNEEMVASKEELQSLNEELTAVNSQLQETLERQRTTADDLQNVLYSTNVATLFLDLDLRIRFFTPEIRSLFAIIPDDIGRKLSDFAALAPDAELDADVRTVLSRMEPLEQEIETKNGVWFRRRILPYRAHNNRVEGVVITFTDITKRKSVDTALEAAKRLAESANATKSRFLAAASHDLRQPLQTLLLLQGLLAKTVQGDRAKNLVSRLDDTLGAMGGMLDTLLDINEIEAGVVHADISAFPVSNLLDRLRDEFTYHAQAKGLELHVVSCHLHVLSDPRLLEQMVRNLISNALKYTSAGRVLIGCRRHGTKLSVEVWDTGIGIAEAEIGTIFEEYHQIGNAARERSQGLGLGLSIVKRLGSLLEHRITVRSRPGKGSSFAVEVPLSESHLLAAVQSPEQLAAVATGVHGIILVVEDDPDLRDLLGDLLRSEGHQVTTAPDGPASLVSLGQCDPDLLLLDYNLPNGLNGLELASEIRRRVGRDIPAILLTGDISSATLRATVEYGYTQLNKPVKRGELLQVISQALVTALPKAPPDIATPTSPARPMVFVVDDDDGVRNAIVEILSEDGQAVAGFPTSEAFLQSYQPGIEACLLVDAYLPGLDGIGLLEHLRSSGHALPAIMITGQSDVQMAVRAMKAGASDFIEKPVSRADLLLSVGRALEQSHDSTKRTAWRAQAVAQVAGLTPRQRQIMVLVVAGHPSKNIAADLGISQRTVENHRASIMHKTGSASLPELARLALTAGSAAADVTIVTPSPTG